jgi:predicted transcriptional regulator
MFTTRHAISLDFTSPRQRQVNEPSPTPPVRRHSEGRSTVEPDVERKQKSRMVSFRVDEDDFARLDALARQTSCSRAEVLRRCLRGVRLRSTIDAQALTAVSRVHADLNRIGGLLKLAIREGVGDRSSYYGLNVELRDAIRQVSRAVERLAGQP